MLAMESGDSGGGKLGRATERAKTAIKSKFSNKSDAAPSDAPKHPALNTIKERISPFLLREQTGTGETTLDWQGREVQIKERTGSIDPELVTDFSKSLKGDLERLMDIQQNTPDVFDRLINDPHFRPYRDLFDKYTRLKEGSAAVGGHAIREFDSTSFDDYMGTDAGFATAFEMRKLKLQDMATNAAVFLDDNLPTTNPEEIEEQDVNTGPGGKAREIGRKVGHFFQEPRTRYGRKIPIDLGITTLDSKGDIAAVITAASTFLGGLGALGGGPVGGLIGAGIPPAVVGVIHAFHRGERVTVEQARAALRIARATDPVRREWAREMYNVDSSNLGIDNNGNVVIRPGIRNNRQLASPAKQSEVLRDILVRENAQIMKAQEAMGIRREQRGGMDLVGLTRPGRNEQFAQRDIPIEISVQREFKRDPRLVDRNGNTCQFQNAQGEWVDNANFNWRNTNRLAAWDLRQEIHRRLLSEKITGDFNDIAEWGKNHNTDLGSAITKAKERGPLILTERKAALNEQDRNLTEDQRRLRAEIPPFTELDTVLTQVAAARRAAEQARRNVTRVTAHPTGLTDELSLLTQVLNDVPAGGAAPFELDVMHEGVRLRITSIAGREAEALRTYQNAVNTISGSVPTGKGADQIITARLKIAKDIYDQQMIPINRDKTAVTAARQAIDAANTAAREVFNRFNTLDAQREATATTSTEMQTARTTIEGWTTPGVADLSTAELQNQSFDELLTRINAVNAGGGGGWPEAENDTPENRERLVRAMAEARAIALEPRVATPSANFEDAINPNGFALLETDLLTRSSEDIRNIMADLIARAPAGSPLNGLVIPANAIDQINEIKNEAQARFTARLRAMQALDREITSRKTIIEGQKTRIDREGIQTPELDAIERAYPLVDDIRSTIDAMTVVPRLVEFLDTAQAATQARYLPEEQANNHSIAYANIMELIFNHRDDNDAKVGTVTGRAVAFERNSNFLTEDVLRDLLVQQFNLVGPPLPAGVVGPPATPTFEQAIDQLRNEIQAGNIPKGQFAQFLTENVIYGYMEPLVPVL